MRDSGSKSWNGRTSNPGGMDQRRILRTGAGRVRHIDGDNRTQSEEEPIERLVNDGELMACRHRGFRQCVDTMRDKVLLERLWQSGGAPWRAWE
jgi:NDP-sugar pyrophosphorylase family protein